MNARILLSMPIQIQANAKDVQMTKLGASRVLVVLQGVTLDSSPREPVVSTVVHYV